MEEGGQWGQTTDIYPKDGTKKKKNSAHLDRGRARSDDGALSVEDLLARSHVAADELSQTVLVHLRCHTVSVPTTEQQYSRTPTAGGGAELACLFVCGVWGQGVDSVSYVDGNVVCSGQSRF